MPLNLNDLMKKAKDRGITTSLQANSNPSQLIRPWQQESVLFETTNITNSPDGRKPFETQQVSVSFPFVFY